MLTMRTLAEIRTILQDQQPYLAQEYGVHVVGVFGSYVRHEQRADSDIDILVELERPPRISRPPQDVFDFHADHANRVAWHDHVTRSEMITPPPLGFGSRFEIDTISAGRPTPMTIEITAFDRPGAYSYRSYTTSAITDSHRTFTAENRGARFQVRTELHFKGIARPFGWFILKFGLERHFEAAVQELKMEMEKA